MDKEGFRHELKYVVGYGEYLSLRARLSQVMERDPNAGDDGRYRISSIYFDNYRDKALWEKRDGAARREKFRIRYYNDDFSFMVLEKKMKIDSLCRKLDAELTREECRRLLAGDTGWMREHREELVRELYVKMKTQQLTPRVLVSYIREPFVYRAGNVRVTFDSDIRSALLYRRSREMPPVEIPVAERGGEMILEVKYDAYLPALIYRLLQTGTCRLCAYSKYAASRRFG